MGEILGTVECLHAPSLCKLPGCWCYRLRLCSRRSGSDGCDRSDVYCFLTNVRSGESRR